MIYLYRDRIENGAPVLDLAVCECEKRAAAFEMRGYERCDYALYRRLWALQDKWSLDAMKLEAITAPLVRVDDAPESARGVTIGI